MPFGLSCERSHNERIYRTQQPVTVENSFTITDTISNTGDRAEPFEILYHMNMGYPLLDEDSEVSIPAVEVIPRDDHAKVDMDNCLKMEKPQLLILSHL